MIQRFAKIGFAVDLLASCAFGQSTGPTNGTVHGVVFISDADGARSVLPATKVSLEVPIRVEAQRAESLALIGQTIGPTSSAELDPS
jgi:hypothetical protein